MKTWLVGVLCCAVLGVGCGDDEVSTAEPLPDGPQLVNPGFLAFGLTAPGAQKVSQIPIVNLGRDPLTISSVSLSGQDAARFTLGNPIESTINPRTATSIPITFRPDQVGGYVANVTINSNAANFDVFIVDVVGPSGTGNDPNLQTADNAVSITIPAGAAEGRGVLRYYNVGRNSLVITGYEFTGPGAASFSLANGTPLPGEECTPNGLECQTNPNDPEVLDNGLFCNLPEPTATKGTCALSVPVADPVVLDIYYNGQGNQNATFRINAANSDDAEVPLTGRR